MTWNKIQYVILSESVEKDRLRGNKRGKQDVNRLNIGNVQHISFVVFLLLWMCLANSLHGPDTLT